MSKNTTLSGYELPCQVAECDSLVGRRGAKGVCPKHYKRLMSHGDPLIARKDSPKDPWRVCSVELCGKPARNRSSEWCKMHYHRWYRHGDTGEAAELVRKSRSGKCAIEDCSKPDTEGIYCSMHGARYRRHGDANIVIAVEDRRMARGEDNSRWKGLDPGYTAAHDRVRRARGSASFYDCVGCGEAAYHWSYDHECPDEITSDVRGYEVSYSPHADQYSPRCVSCHKRFDLDRINAFPISQFYPLEGTLWVQAF